MNWFPIAALPVLAVVLLVAVALSGCVKVERDPLAAYFVAPKAFNLWIVSF